MSKALCCVFDIDSIKLVKKVNNHHKRINVIYMLIAVIGIAGIKSKMDTDYLRRQLSIIEKEIKEQKNTKGE